MSKITSIGTSLPSYKHAQESLCSFADAVYSADAAESRKLKFLYRHSGINSRYSVIPDFSLPAQERIFFAKSDNLEPFPGIEERMTYYTRTATPMSVEAIQNCIEGKIGKDEITHLITVSCTGMSAPGLDLDIMEIMKLSPTLVRSSVNFMGCYAAIHAIKLADAFCRTTPKANVVVVCTELCTLHFQKQVSADNITASLLFADGSAAMLFQSETINEGITIDHFYSQVSFKGRKDMAWQISSQGFLMTLTGFVPDLIKEDFEQLVANALSASGITRDEITHWCIHPGGKKILDTIVQSLGINTDDLRYSYKILQEYGNMSSATIVFVLKEMLAEFRESGENSNARIFGAAFGPGLTMETFTASYG